MIVIFGIVVVILTIGFVVDLVGNDGDGMRTIKELFKK